MFDTVLSSVTAFAGSGVLGIIANIGLGWIEKKKEESARVHELAMRKEDREDMKEENNLAIQRINAEGDIRAAEMAVEADTQSEKNSYSGLQAAIAADQAGFDFESIGGMPKWVQGMMAIVEAARKLTRPALTVYLLIYSSILTYDRVPGAEHWHIMAGSATGFWFGERFLTKKRNDNHG